MEGFRDPNATPGQNSAPIHPFVKATGNQLVTATEQHCDGSASKFFFQGLGENASFITACIKALYLVFKKSE